MAMTPRPRTYSAMLYEHFRVHRQMAFVSGPRQVGKTMTRGALGTHCLNWDNVDDRRPVLRGPDAVAAKLGLERLSDRPALVVFDELHKHAKWKAFLKGFFDVYGKRAQILVTGSSRLDIVKRGSDSLMGRCFPFRMHPWSVAECLATELPDKPIHAPLADAAPRTVDPR